MAANASAATKNPYIPVYDAGVKVYGELPSGGGTPGEPQVPARPSGLQAVPGNASVALSWTPVSGASSYTVKRSLVSGGPYTTVGTATAAVYNDSGLTNGVDYYYVVTATNSVGESTASAQVTAKPREITVPAGALRVQYRTNDTSPGDSQIRSQFRIVNTGTEAIPLSGLKLRYYYTVDGDKPQEFHCDYAQVGSGNVSGTFGKLSTPVALADSYLEISLPQGQEVWLREQTAGRFRCASTSRIGPITMRATTIRMEEAKQASRIGIKSRCTVQEHLSGASNPKPYQRGSMPK